MKKDSKILRQQIKEKWNILREKHVVINWYRGKDENGIKIFRKIWVCSGHCCDFDGLEAVRN